MTITENERIEYTKLYSGTLNFYKSVFKAPAPSSVWESIKSRFSSSKYQDFYVNTYRIAVLLIQHRFNKYFLKADSPLPSELVLKPNPGLDALEKKTTAQGKKLWLKQLLNSQTLQLISSSLNS